MLTSVAQPKAKRDLLLEAILTLRARARCKTLDFACFPDEEASLMIQSGKQAHMLSDEADTNLIVNPMFRFQTGNELPGEVRRTLADRNVFRDRNPKAWVQHPGTGVWTAFSAGDELAQALSLLRPSLPAPSSLGSNLHHALVLADILVLREHEERQRSQWKHICHTAREQFQDNGYAVLRNIINPLYLSAMRKYYRALIASGRLPLGDPQTAQRYWLHSEVLGLFFHPQLAGLVSRIADEPVKPSYVYLAAYQPGSDLPRHVDREQCEFSISFLVDHQPDPGGPCGWPLFLENQRSTDTVSAVDLAVGDAVIYKGREVAHYRNELPNGHYSTLLLLHYVPSDFSGRLW